MKKNKLTQKDWLEYLNNLNNREINKQSSSGFTTWALFGLIGFTLFKLLDSLPIIFMDTKNVFLSKFFITNILNFCIVIMIFIQIISIPRDEKRKIQTELMKRIYLFASGIIYFICIVGFFSNIYITVDLKYYGLRIFPYCVFAIYEISFIIFFSINRITVKKEKKMPRIDLGYFYNKKLKNLVKNISIFLCLVFSFLFLFSIYQITQIGNILKHLDVLKTVIYLSVFVGAIVLFIGNYISRIRNRWLEELERKIMLQNLSKKEIVKSFIDKFIGKDIVQWLKEIEDETKKENNRILRLYNKLEKEVNSINQKEKDLNKRNKKEKNITKMMKIIVSCNKKYKEKYVKSVDKIKHVIKQGPLSEEERLLINKFIRSMERQNKNITDFNLKFKTFTKLIVKYVNGTKKLEKSKDKKAFEKQT